MKRILSIFILLIALIVGATHFDISSNEIVLPIASGDLVLSQDAHQHVYKGIGHWLTTGEGCVIEDGVRLLPQFSFRQFSFSFYATRVKNFKDQISLQLFDSRENMLARAAFEQLEGYYLYQLCKLLI